MKNKSFLYENFQFLEVKFSIYLNRRVFVMKALTALVGLLSLTAAGKMVLFHFILNLL